MSNMVVRTNIYALNSHRNMKNVGVQQKQASNRLSSGYRINSAADDAAGLAISETMRAQIRGLDQASRNAQDGQAMILTTEGGLEEIGNMLQRTRELIVQASNDTNTQGQRDMIQQEIQQLGLEINGMQERVEFNTNKVLNMGIAADISAAQSAFTKATVTFETALASVAIKNASAVGKDASAAGKMTSANVKYASADTKVTSAATKSAAAVLKTDIAAVKSAAAAAKQTYADSLMEAMNARSAAAQLIIANSSAADTAALAAQASAALLLASANKFGATGSAGVLTASATKLTASATKLTASAAKLMVSASQIKASAAGLKGSSSTLTASADSLRTSGKEMTKNALDDFADGEAAMRKGIIEGTPSTGSFTAWFQAGANEDQGITFDFAKVHSAVTVAGRLVTHIGDNIVAPGTNGESGVGYGESISGMLESVQSALDNVNSVRANLGAVQNRMDYTMRSLDISSENLSDSESRVRNADMAKEMMKFTMSNVLQQAAVSMLSQANQLPQNLLQLLR